METWTKSDVAHEEAFVKFAVLRFGMARDELNLKVRALERELANLLRGIAVLNCRPQTRRNVRRLGAKRTHAIQLQGKIEVLQRHYDDVIVHDEEMRLRERYKEMRAIPRVLDVRVSGDNLVVFTDTLYGKDDVRGWHKVGPFEISIDLISRSPSRVRWINLDGPHCVAGRIVIPPGGMMLTETIFQGPPNIQADGSVKCLGNAAEPLKEALRCLDYPEVVAIVVRYPECMGAHQQIKFWPLVFPSEVPSWYIETFGW